ncbi:AAA family ATPase [Myxosarcina sp. GI1(2024)]
MIRRQEQIDWIESMGLLPLPVVPLDAMEGEAILDDKGVLCKVAFYEPRNNKPVYHRGKAPSYFNERGKFRFATWKEAETVEPEWFINDSVGVGTRCTNTIRYIDIDQHAEAVFNFFKGRLGDRLNGVRVERTPSGGYHIPIKLMSPLSEEKEIDNYIVPDVAGKEKIGELRGEHQMVVNAPTTGYALLDEYTFGLLTLEGYELEGLLGMYDQGKFNQATQDALNSKQDDGSQATVAAYKEIQGHVNERGLDPAEADALVQRVAEVQGTAHKLDRVLKNIDPVSCTASGHINTVSNTEVDSSVHNTSNVNVDVTSNTGDVTDDDGLLVPIDFEKEREERNNRKYLVSELLPKGQLNLLHGESSAGKTLLMLDLMMSVMSGQDFLGHPVEKGLVMHIDTDRAEKTREYLEYRGFDKDVLGDEIWSNYLMFNSLTLPQNMEKLKKTIQHYQPVLVVFDSLTTLTTIDVNKDEIATKVLQPLKEIFETLKTTGIVIHHDNKTKETNSQGKVKGSALIPARVDARWHLAVKPSGVRELRFEGHIAHKLYELDITNGFDEWYEKGCFTPTLELSRSLEELSSNRDKVVAVLQNNPGRRFDNPELAKHIGVSNSTVRALTRSLASDGTINKERDPDKKNGWVYFIPSPVSSVADEVMEQKKQQKIAIDELVNSTSAEEWDKLVDRQSLHDEWSLDVDNVPF